MRRHTALVAATTALGLALGLSACSADDPSPASPTASPAAGDRGADGAGDDADDAPPAGPLDDYVGVGAGVATTIEDADMLEYEERIARCMADDGFEYVPYVAPFDATFLPDGTVSLAPSRPSFPDLPPAEFAARFGYGISTEPPAAREQRSDPNEAIVARMSVAERVAYHRALYGPENALDDEGFLAGDGIASSEASCVGRADAGQPTTEELQRVEERTEQVRDSFASLLKRVRALREQVAADPRVRSATETWSRCLAAAGHPGFTELDQPQRHAREQAALVLGRDLRGSGAADPSRLAALRRAEVALAVADQQCLVDWRATNEVVRDELEQDFVEDNLAELEDFRSAMSAAVAQTEQ